MNKLLSYGKFKMRDYLKFKYCDFPFVSCSNNLRSIRRLEAEIQTLTVPENNTSRIPQNNTRNIFIKNSYQNLSGALAKIS